MEDRGRSLPRGGWIDGLVGGGRRRRRNYEQAEGLLGLAEQLSAILVPVTPRADFRLRLHDNLTQRARSREPLGRPNAVQQQRGGILLGAAAVGSLVSVTGIVLAVVLRHRHGRASHFATG